MAEWKVLQRRSVKPPIYIGEGKENLIDDLGITDILLNQDAMEEGELCHVAQILFIKTHGSNGKVWVRHSVLS